MSEEQDRREKCCSPAGLLDLCVGAAGSQPAIPFLSGFVCLLEHLYQLCYVNRNIENGARNGKVTRNPKTYPHTFPSHLKIHPPEHAFVYPEDKFQVLIHL